MPVAEVVATLSRNYHARVRSRAILSGTLVFSGWRFAVALLLGLALLFGLSGMLARRKARGM